MNNETEVALHETLHKHSTKEIKVEGYFENPRLHIFPHIEKIIGKKISGKVIRHGDRDDHFYRKCEYLTAIHHSGLSFVKQHDVSGLVNKKSLCGFISRFILRAKRYFKNAEQHQDAPFSEMRSQKLKPKHLLLLCQKPLLDEIPPHRWCRGKT